MQNITFRQPGVMDSWSTTPGGVTTHVPVSATQVYIFRTQSGYTGKRQKGKPKPNHAYLLQSSRVHGDNAAEQLYSDRSKTGQSGPILSPTVGGLGFELLPAADYSGIASAALDRLNDRVRGNLDVSVDLAEAHKTKKMFNATERLVDLTKTFTKKFGVVKLASNAWLEYVYGIKPLVNTIFGCANENINIVLNSTSRFKARASGPIRPSKVRINTIWGFIDYPVTNSSIKASISYGIDVRTDQFDLARWSTLNPVGIAYELMPFSFVADWVLNVGGYLRNMETYLLYANKFRGGYSTSLITGNLAFQLLDKNLSGNMVSQNSFHKGFVEFVSIQRSLLASYPVPTLPSFDVNMGSSRLLSAASLLGQMLRR